MNFAGGPVFWILAALGAGALAVFLERFVELRRAHIDWQDFVKGVVNVLESGNEAEALAICEDTPVPAANVTAAAIRHRKSGSQAMHDAIDAQGRAEVARLRRRIATISVMGGVAPLVGLFGTIVGFIRAVSLVNGDAIVSKSELVSASVAAMTDAAAGIAVAVAAAIMYAALRIRLDRIVADLEAAATDVFARLSPKEGGR